MRPKQPQIKDLYDFIKVYSLSGSRDSMGGYVEQENHLRDVWGAVKLRTKPLETSGGSDGQRDYEKSLEAVVYAGAAEEGNVVEFNGAKYYITGVKQSYRGMETIIGKETK